MRRQTGRPTPYSKTRRERKGENTHRTVLGWQVDMGLNLPLFVFFLPLPTVCPPRPWKIFQGQRPPFSISGSSAQEGLRPGPRLWALGRLTACPYPAAPPAQPPLTPPYSWELIIVSPPSVYLCTELKWHFNLPLDMGAN